MPWRTNGAPKTASEIGLLWPGVAPHSVHQISTSSSAARLERAADVERQVSVRVRGDEVERRALGDHELEEVADPAGRRSRRTADEQPLVDRLDRPRRDVVQAEVLGLRAAPEDLEIRLVPDLEAPARDLVDAEPLDEPLGQPPVELAPAVPVVRRRDDPAVLEDRRVRIRREVVRHERHLDDRPQPRRAGPPRRRARPRRSRRPAPRPPRGTRRARRAGSSAPAHAPRRGRPTRAGTPRARPRRSSAPPTCSSEMTKEKCSEPIMCHTGSSRPAGRSCPDGASIGSAGSASGRASTGSDSSPGSASASGAVTDATAYQHVRPRSPSYRSSRAQAPRARPVRRGRRARTGRRPWRRGGRGNRSRRARAPT